jgi:predicted component of type VI protein secretion system
MKREKALLFSIHWLSNACFARRLGCSGTRANEGVNHCTRLWCVEHGGAKELVPLHVLNEHSSPIDVNDFRAF